MRCPAVVCCRCAPTQKALMVRLLKRSANKRCAAIGPPSSLLPSTPHVTPHTQCFLPPDQTPLSLGRVVRTRVMEYVDGICIGDFRGGLMMRWDAHAYKTHTTPTMHAHCDSHTTRLRYTHYTLCLRHTHTIRLEYMGGLMMRWGRRWRQRRGDDSGCRCWDWD